uniref:Dynamin-1-like protein n=1 Tax=Acrobeloides nanus TaxID=290746 RepID=A0A914CED9_9BILA
NITDEPIKLTIYSERVVNLTLVDLPGLTKNKVGDQPDDIKSRIEQLVLSYITEKNTLILAVSQATNDLANSEAIEIAMRPSVDPTCERTLVVLTQLDLMNPGTDARAILQGKVIPMKLGIIGVKNRTQKDIDEGKSLAKCIEEEKFWFQTHYSELAEVNGVPYLTKRLNEGPYNPLFLPEEAFVELVKEPIERLKDPCLKCVELVYEELLNVADYCFENIKEKTGERFPNLINRINGVVSNLIINQLEPTQNIIEELVDIETAFINTDHPDIQYDGLKKFLEDPEKNPDPLLQDLMQQLDCIYLLEDGPQTMPLSKKDLVFGFDEERRRSHVLPARSVQVTNLDDFDDVASETTVGSNVSNSINMPRLDPNIERHQLTNSRLLTNGYINGPGENKIRLTQRQKYDCAKTIRLIREYFNIIRKTLEDLVPKTIMKRLVNHVIDKVHHELLNELVVKNNDSKANIDELLQESHDIMVKRDKETAMLHALTEANKIVKNIQFPKSRNTILPIEESMLNENGVKHSFIVNRRPSFTRVNGRKNSSDDDLLVN